MVLETVHAKREKKTTVIIIIRKRERKREREKRERIAEEIRDGKKIVLLLKTWWYVC